MQQRPGPRAMGRSQHREPSSEVASQDPTATAANHRGRNNPKLKVLVRSHAMREETSPPREPSPPHCISIITSPPPSSPIHSSSPIRRHSPSSSSTLQNPCMTLSPSLSPGHSSRCSPTSLVASPTPPAYHSAHSPVGSRSPTNHVTGSMAVQHMQDNTARANNNKFNAENNNFKNTDTATVRTQDSLNSFACSKNVNENGSSDKQNVEINVSDDSSKNSETCAVNSQIFSSDSIVRDTNTINSSPNITSNNQISYIKTTDVQRNVDNSSRTNQTEQTNYICDCFNQICTKCTKNSERNINNNLRDNINNNNNNVIGSATHCSNTLTVSRANTKHKLRHQSSSQGSFDGSSSTSPCLSRDSSTEQYTDTTGIDLTQFILETLNKNAKDRVMMLKIEQELVNLAKDKMKTHYKFPPMSSYQRMLVHRCAAYFGMDHNIETSGKCVVVNKTKNTRLPDMRFKEHIREDLLFPEEPRRSILKRDSNSFEDCNYKSPDRHMGLENRRSKSFEEREEEYEKARRRIFKDGTMQECDSQEDFIWSEVPWPENDNSKIRLLPPDQPIIKNRLLKIQSVDGKSETLRPCVAKSYSFGGYGGTVSVLSRGDSVSSTHSAGPRLLTKQDSSTSTISWRLSPSSSGYKSQSQRSDSVTPSPTATPHQLSDVSTKGSVEEREEISEEGRESEEKTAEKEPSGDGNQCVWAVTDMQSVPKGSVLINPQTGQPFTNKDGSIYHFDPSNPPPGLLTNSKPPPSPVKLISPQKSPVKEYAQSPKKPKSRTSPLKNRLINSATSPSFPVTPPIQGQAGHSISYVPSTHLENASNMPIQPYPVYPNGYAPPSLANSETNVPVYQPPVGMMYTQYGVPQQYENRNDSSVTDLSGYFLNMAVSDPPCNNQSVGYQTPNTYWNQQPVTYYQPQTNQPQQRYPLQISVAGQPQTYVSTYTPNYVPVPSNPPSVQPTTDMVPMYQNPPVQMMYPTHQQSNTSLFIQNPNPMLYAQNPNQMYPTQGYQPYQSNTPTPTGSNSNSYTPNYGQPNANQCSFSQSVHRSGFDCLPRNPAPKCNKYPPKLVQVQHQSSNHNSGGSSSPASTVINGYFPNPNTQMNYRQCTPPQTPPSQNLAYGYPPNYVQPSMIFRPMGGIRASPPVNIRSSRSPTPAPEYPQIASVDRNRYPVGPTVYGMGVPCIFPGDVRLVAGRTQPPVYRQPYRQQNLTHQPISDNSSGRSHKVRKPRAKLPALPPSGRQSNQSIPNHAQRF